MHQLGKLTKNFVVLDSCNDNKRLSILFYSIRPLESCNTKQVKNIFYLYVFTFIIGHLKGKWSWISPQRMISALSVMAQALQSLRFTPPCV